MTRITALPAVLALAVISSSGHPSHAQRTPAAWPQWGGPARNFHVESASIAQSWPEAGPRQLWRHPLGEGYSSILVDGDTLVTMYRRDDDEVVVALDAATGTRRWTHAYRAPLLN